MQVVNKKILQQEFARNLRRLMKEADVTQDQLAETIGISQGSVSRYLGGKILPDWDTLFKLMQRFKKPLSYFIGPLPATVSDGQVPYGESKTGGDFDTEEVYRNIVEGNTEYLLIPRSVLQEKYRLVALENIQRDAAESAQKNQTIERLQTANEFLNHALVQALSDALHPGKTAEIKHSEK